VDGGRTERCSCVHHAPQSPVSEPVYGRIWRRPAVGGLINQYEARSLKPQIRHHGWVLEPDRAVDLAAAFARLVVLPTPTG
jgi:hypothetical protein